MNLTISNMSSKQSFSGLFSKDKVVNVESCGTGTKSLHEKTYFPFLNESQESINSAMQRGNREYATVINTNGFGAQLHSVKVNQGEALSITKADYSAYKHLRSNADMTAKVETALIERGLTNKLNGPFKKKLGAIVSRIFHK